MRTGSLCFNGMGLDSLWMLISTLNSRPKSGISTFTASGRATRATSVMSASRESFGDVLCMQSTMSAIVANWTGSVFPPQKMCSLRLHSCTSARTVGRSSMTSPYFPAEMVCVGRRANRIPFGVRQVGGALGHRREASDQAAHQPVVVGDGGIEEEQERFRSGGHGFFGQTVFSNLQDLSSAGLLETINVHSSYGARALAQHRHPRAQ